MSGVTRIFGQAGENPKNLPDNLLKKLTVKRGNAPWEVLKSFGSNPSMNETYVSIMIKLGPEGKVLGSRWIAQGAMEDISVDISDLTGTAGDKDQKLVGKLDMSDLGKFEFGMVGENRRNFSRWRGSEERLMSSMKIGKGKTITDPEAINGLMEDMGVTFSIRCVVTPLVGAKTATIEILAIPVSIEDLRKITTAINVDPMGGGTSPPKPS